jgi:hypothetical protein
VIAFESPDHRCVASTSGGTVSHRATLRLN